MHEDENVRGSSRKMLDRPSDCKMRHQRLLLGSYSRKGSSSRYAWFRHRVKRQFWAMISLLCILVSVKAYRRSYSALMVGWAWAPVSGKHTPWTHIEFIVNIGMILKQFCSSERNNNKTSWHATRLSRVEMVEPGSRNAYWLL